MTLNPVAYKPYSDPDDFIREVTDLIWVQRDVSFIVDNYEPDSIVHGALGTTVGRQGVIDGSLVRIAQTPQRVGQAEDVIWEARGDDAFLSSHLVLSVDRNQTGVNSLTYPFFRSRTIANCLYRRGRMVEEWVVRDSLAGALQQGIDPEEAALRLGFAGYQGSWCDPAPVDVLAEGDSGPRTDERTVLCVLTHDPKFDVPLLEVALRIPVAYVGAMGSRRTHDERLDRLAEAGLSEAEIARCRRRSGWTWAHGHRRRRRSRSRPRSSLGAGAARGSGWGDRRPHPPDGRALTKDRVSADLPFVYAVEVVGLLAAPGHRYDGRPGTTVPEQSATGASGSRSAPASASSATATRAAGAPGRLAHGAGRRVGGGAGRRARLRAARSAADPPQRGAARRGGRGAARRALLARLRRGRGACCAAAGRPTPAPGSTSSCPRRPPGHARSRRDPLRAPVRRRPPPGPAVLRSAVRLDAERAGRARPLAPHRPA